MSVVPAEDRRLSPFTGWTRAHWEHAADQLLAGVRPYATPRHGLINLPGPRQSVAGAVSDGLEGFARTFLLAAFRLAGADGGGGDDAGVSDLADWYAAGLDAGSDRGSGESWTHAAEVRQTMVEAASIAVGLFETRPWIWDRLSVSTQARVAAWLFEATTVPAYTNNWLLFQVMINCFLKAVAAPHDQAQIERNLDLIDSWYRGDGWYSDGPGQSFDHYVGWAMHLYTALWCRMDGDATAPDRAAVYRDRVRLFLADFRLLFGSDGAPLHQGRSLTYRFAAAAAPWAGALIGASPLAPGETRRLASGAVRHFLDRGAISDAGVLSLGWHGEFEPVSQIYSGPASPYWASKGFLGLLLSPEAPEWQAREEPLAVETNDFVVEMRSPGWLAWGTKDDGIVRIANHGSDRHPVADGRMWPHYRKLSYATAAGPDLGPEADADPVDNEVVLASLTDRRRDQRGAIHRLGLRSPLAASVFFPHEPRGAGGEPWSPWRERIETTSLVRGRVEIRAIHATTTSPAPMRLGGWAVADDVAPAVSQGPTWAMAKTGAGLVTFVGGLYGLAEVGTISRTGANAFGHMSVTPFVSSTDTGRAEQILVAMVVLTAVPLDVDEELALVANVTVSDDRRQLAVLWSDGVEHTMEFVCGREGPRT